MRISRRSFLGATVAGAAATCLHTGLATRRARLCLIDGSVPESALFARALGGATLVEASLRDPIALRASMLEAVAEGRPVLACTREATAFVSAELVRGAGVRLTVLGRHRAVGDGRLSHTIYGYPATPEIAAALDGPLWPARWAKLSSAWAPVGRAAAQHHAGVAPRLPDSPGYLVTWRLAAA